MKITWRALGVMLASLLVSACPVDAHQPCEIVSSFDRPAPVPADTTRIADWPVPLTLVDRGGGTWEVQWPRTLDATGYRYNPGTGERILTQDTSFVATMGPGTRFIVQALPGSELAVDTVPGTATPPAPGPTPAPDPAPPPQGGGVAELPRLTIRWSEPVPANVVRVAAGDNLQAAINAAQPGDELRLDPAGVWGPINLPSRSWNGSSWIRVTCDGCTLPAYGDRVTASQVAGLPVVESGNNKQAINAKNGSSGWWFTGIHFVQPPATFTYEMLVFLGADHLSFDRIAVTGNNETYNSGQPPRGVTRCILGNATWIQVIGSRLDQCNKRWNDAQAYVQWEGGPTRLHNNFLNGSGEIVMIGGADPKNDASITADIEITGNQFWWDPQFTLTGGNVFAFKNHLEFKTGRRALVEGNTFENHWTGVSSQYNAIVIKGLDQGGDRNPNCPWCLTEDITFRGNTILNAAAGIHLCPSCEGVGHVLRRVTIDGNSIQIVPSQSSATTRREAIALTGKTQYGSGFTITNNVVTGAGRWMLADHGGEPHGGDLAVCGWEQTGNSSTTETFVGRNALPPDHFLARSGCPYLYEAP